MLGNYNQPYQPPSSGIGGIFGFGGSERLTPQTIQQITLQLQQQGIPTHSVANVQEELFQMTQKGTEKISNVLKQFISPELSQQVLSNIELEELEEDITGIRGNRETIRGDANYVPQRRLNSNPYSRRGSNPRRVQFSDSEPYYEGGKKRRTRRRRQHGGDFSDNTSSYGSNAAPFQGGRRRRKSHKKHTKRCKH
jgi:hypothetical protein